MIHCLRLNGCALYWEAVKYPVPKTLRKENQIELQDSNLKLDVICISSHDLVIHIWQITKPIEQKMSDQIQVFYELEVLDGKSEELRDINEQEVRL